MSNSTNQPGNPPTTLATRILLQGAQWLSAAYKRNPRQAGIVTLMAAVALAGFGKLMIGRNSPEEAAGARLSSSLPDATVSLARAEQRAHSVMSLAAWAAQPVESRRNLFAVPLDYYRRDPNSPDGLNSAEDAAKFSTAKADEIKERQILMDNVRESSASLILESTVMGAHPRAWVNGLLVGLGESIGTTGFSIAKIEPRRIFVEREGVQVEISMK
jgi:hypothetical protein